MELTLERYEEYEKEGADEAIWPQVAPQQVSNDVTYR